MFGFVLIPDRKVLNRAIEMNKKVESSVLLLDDAIVLPHLTVLQAPIQSSFNYEEALDLFRDYTGFSYEPKTQISELYQQDKYIMLGVQNAKWLSDFNRLIVEYTSSFIDVPEIDSAKTFSNEAQLNSYKATGYRFNLDAYAPHFTVAVSDENVSLPGNTLSGVNVRFHSLAYAEHGENGSIKRILSSRQLPMTWN